MQNIFLDTEFTGLRQNADLISLALIAEDGREFYAEFTDYDLQKAPDPNWITAHVIGNLFLTDQNLSRDLHRMYIRDNSHGVRAALEIWLEQFPKKHDNYGNLLPSIRIWADVPHYDWVLFCELFGGALKIPPQMHYMPMDLATLLYAKGIPPDKPRSQLLEERVGKDALPEGVPHNALFDARVGMKLLQNFGGYGR